MTRVLLLAGTIALLPGMAVANPVVWHTFSELTLEESGWQLELTPLDSLQGCFLTSSSDTAWFRPDIPFEQYLIVTADDLLQPFYLNPEGDTLALWEPQWPEYPSDWLNFGDGAGAEIAAPPAGFSICASHDEGFFYLDASPSMGAPNDTLNAMGDIHGAVTDSVGTPIEGVRVIYGYDNMTGEELVVLTDGQGEFRLHDYAKQEFLSFSGEGCPAEGAMVQIWPDTTVEMSIALDCEMTADPWEGPAYHLLVSQPNPFATGTSFLYALPTPADVRVAVYDARGALVKVLFEGRQAEGRHTVTWAASDIPSGTYFCRLTTARATLTTRCIVAR